jgi:hypothetical protein
MKIKVLILLSALLSTSARAEHPVEKYAWYFPNFLSDPCVPGADWYPWARYRETYIGVSAEPSDNFGFDRVLYESIYKTKLGGPGNCFGMCLLSLAINDRGGHLGFCAPVSGYTGDVTGVPNTCTTNVPYTGPGNPELLRAIQEMHGHQLNLAAVRHLIGHLATKFGRDGKYAFDYVAGHKPCLVSIFKDLGSPGVGHVLLAYDTGEVNGEKRIFVYDPNRSWGIPAQRDWYLNGKNYIATNQGWSFDFDGGTPWDSGKGWLTPIPLSIAGPRDRNPASLGLSVGSLLQKIILSGAGASLVQMTDGRGMRLFVPGTREIETNPGLGMLSAGPVLNFGGIPGAEAGLPPSQAYHLLAPQDGPFDLAVRSGQEGYELTVASRIGFLRVASRGGSGVDRVQVADPGTLEPSLRLFNTAGAAELEVEIAQGTRPDKGSRSFQLKRLAMPAGGLVSIQLFRDQSRLQVESPFHELAFDLELGSTEHGVRRSLERQDIVVAAGDAALLAPADWADLAQTDLRVAPRALPASAVEWHSGILYGSGGGPVGPDFTAARDMGDALRGSTAFDRRTGLYTQVSAGSGIGAGGDGCQFAYRTVAGDFEFTVEVVERLTPAGAAAPQGRHGLMARRDVSPVARSSQLQTLDGGGTRDWPRWAFRPLHGDGESHDESQMFNYAPDQRPRFLKMVRRGETFYGFLSRDGEDWEPAGGDTWYGLGGGPVLVGFASTSGTDLTGIASTIRFKVLELGPIATPLPLPLPDAGARHGEVLYENDFSGPDGSAPEGFSVTRRSGAFTPALRGGRLRLSDETAPGSAVSALSDPLIAGIDSSVHQFDFDLFLARGPGGDPGEGATFVLLGGAGAGRAGFPGAGLGYAGIGREPGTDRNLSTNSLAVEFDTVLAGGPHEGQGSPDSPSLHVGINGQNNVFSVVRTAEGLPDPFAPEGIHVRVRYNRGRVQVDLGPGGSSSGPLVRALAADLLPLSFATIDESAVFGFTAATGDLTETAEVDALVVTRLGCAEKEPVIAGVPEEIVPLGATVVLDGSGSRGEPGEEDEPVLHTWSIASGEARIVGPTDGPTVNVRPLAAGEVVVRLTVDGLRCSNPASALAAIAVGEGPAGNWTLCDCTGDGARNITDPIRLLSWLFAGAGVPACPQACDCSNDGATNISDAIFDLNFLFLGGTPPAPPYPGCGSFPACGNACFATGG